MTSTNFYRKKSKLSHYDRIILSQKYGMLKTPSHYRYWQWRRQDLARGGAQVLSLIHI